MDEVIKQTYNLKNFLVVKFLTIRNKLENYLILFARVY